MQSIKKTLGKEEEAPPDFPVSFKSFDSLPPKYIVSLQIPEMRCSSK
jgi:hypothetical protein